MQPSQCLACAWTIFCASTFFECKHTSQTKLYICLESIGPIIMIIAFAEFMYGLDLTLKLHCLCEGGKS